MALRTELPRARAGPNRGAVLVIALLVMAALFPLGIILLAVSNTETQIARNGREATQAFYVAATGVVRLQRDLVAQFAVPYRVGCLAPAALGDLTRPVRITGEPLGVPGQTLDADGSATCAPPRTAAYYLLLDAGNQPISPAGPTWRAVPYLGDNVGGRYWVELRNATPPNALPPQLPNTIEARVTATTGTAIGAFREIQARFQVDRFSPAEHAVFVDWGIWRGGGEQNMTFAGPVFARGRSPTAPAVQFGSGGSADAIVNYYKGLDATLSAAIPPPPAKANPATGESEITLDATLRAYQGTVEIRSTSATVGEPTLVGNGVKESLDAVYTNQGFAGDPGAAQVYADNGTGGRFDLPRELTGFPDLTGPYTGPPLPLGSAPPASHDEYLRASGLGIGENLTIDGATGAFSYPPGLSDLAQCSGNCLIYRPPTNSPASVATPPTLLVKGIVWVKGTIVLGGSGANRLPAIQYQGAGSLYARTGALDSWGGSIQVTSDLLPSPFKDADNTIVGARFPTDHRLGLISAGSVTIGDSGTSSGGSAPPPIRIAAAIYSDSGMSNAASYQIAGSVMARHLSVWQSAGIYYVPGLATARPPGMPGATASKAESPYFVRTLYWRDVIP